MPSVGQQDGGADAAADEVLVPGDGLVADDPDRCPSHADPDVVQGVAEPGAGTRPTYFTDSAWPTSDHDARSVIRLPEDLCLVVGAKTAYRIGRHMMGRLGYEQPQ